MDSTIPIQAPGIAPRKMSSSDAARRTTKSDRENSVCAKEFLWDTTGLTEAGRMIAPALLRRVHSIKPKKILDLGCGNGALSAYLASHGFCVAATDMSASGMALARQNYPGVLFFESHMGEPLPLQERGACDLVISTEVIEHLFLPRQLFARAREALSIGGRMILTTPYHGYLKNLAIALAGKFDDHWHPLKDFGHVKFFSVRTLRQLVEEEGFTVTEVCRMGRIRPLAKSMMMVARLK